MTWTDTPVGTVYTRQQTEYQHFPEEFFSGADVVIYFGDTFIADLTGLEYTLIENLRPIYGYASYTWDAVKRGTRIVQGSFRIAFREAGYLFRVLDHIAQLGGDKAAPALSYILSGQPVPKWHADALQTIEDLLGEKTKTTTPVKYVLLTPGEYELVDGDLAVVWSKLLADRLSVSIEWDDKARKVIIGDKVITPLRVVDGKAYIFVRDVAEALGFNVSYNAANGTITMSRPGTPVPVASIKREDYIMQNGMAIMDSRKFANLINARVSWDSAKKAVVINGQPFEPARLENGVSYIRIRQVAESLGYHVKYADGTIEILKPTNIPVATLKRGEYQIETRHLSLSVMPARRIAQRLGVSVDFDDVRRKVIIGGREFTPQRIVNGTAYVYVREVARALGYIVLWADETKSILLAPPGSMLITQEKFKIVPGVNRAVIPAQYLCSILGANPSNPSEFKVENDGVYYFGRRFTKVNDIFPGQAGVYVIEVLSDFNYGVEYVDKAKCILIVPPGLTVASTQPPTLSEYRKSMNDYEKEVWGDVFVPERAAARHYRPYFYSGQYLDLLQKTGFDIYIVYGPLSHDVKERKNILPDLVRYETTVKAIRNVQLLRCSQVLSPTGQPIEEIYEFIAMDLD